MVPSILEIFHKMFGIKLNGGVYYNRISIIDSSKWNRVSNFMCLYTWTKWGCKIYMKKKIEVASGLLLEMNVPTTYWLDVVLTVVYLINRIPLQVLKRKSPLQVSQSSAPLFPVPPKIFGCVYFVHILKHQTQNHLSVYF